MVDFDLSRVPKARSPPRLFFSFILWRTFPVISKVFGQGPGTNLLFPPASIFRDKGPSNIPDAFLHKVHPPVLRVGKPKPQFFGRSAPPLFFFFFFHGASGKRGVFHR